MTRRLYWEEPLESRFSAHITRFVRKGADAGVVLDRTLFHPEGGGQPCDTGFLSLLDSGLAVALGRSDLPVAKVEEDGPDIVHILDAASMTGFDARVLDRLPGTPEGGWAVDGTIDWSLRFDLMQQHTGQHVLSRAFEETAGAPTVGFHLAKDYCSIDLDIANLSPEGVAKAEDRANQVVFQDVPVVAREYAKGELSPDLRMRFQIESDLVRVVYVGQFDACACGGTHVTSSGQIGLIKVNQTDRAHGGVRVVFRCGWRALADYRDRQNALDGAARALSQAPQAVPEAARALVDKVQALQDLLDEAQESLLEFEIESRLRDAAEGEPGPVVAAFPGRSPEQLKVAAKRLCESSGRLTVCFAREPRFSAVVICPPSAGPAQGKVSVSAPADARAVVSAIAAAWGGRGGGTPQMAQLGSKEPLVADDRAVEEDIRRICREMSGQVEDRIR